MFKNKVGVTPREIADSIVVLDSLKSATIVYLRCLLSKEGSQLRLLCKLADLVCVELEKYLQVSARDFSRLVNLFDEFL